MNVEVHAEFAFLDDEALAIGPIEPRGRYRPGVAVLHQRHHRSAQGRQPVAAPISGWTVMGYLTMVQSVVPGDVALHPAPMSHGSGMCHLPYVLQGGLNVVPKSGGFDADECLTLAAHWTQASFFAAPTMVRAPRRSSQVAGAAADGPGHHLLWRRADVPDRHRRGPEGDRTAFRPDLWPGRMPDDDHGAHARDDQRHHAAPLPRAVGVGGGGAVDGRGFGARRDRSGTRGWRDGRDLRAWRRGDERLLERSRRRPPRRWSNGWLRTGDVGGSTRTAS